MLAGVDRAAFSVALAARLRHAGLRVGVSSLAVLTNALEASEPDTVSSLYWTTRITLVKRQQDLATFDEVFRSVFDESHVPLDPHARRSGLAPRAPEGVDVPLESDREGPEQNEGANWASSPRTVASGELGEDDDTAFPERLPSSLASLVDVSFPDFEADDLEALSLWLNEALASWPTRLSRRTKPQRSGPKVALRPTMQRARATGFEPIHLIGTREIRKPRRVLMLCDVSQSMESYATAYLHLMRAAALRVDAEVFAFSTSLTRLTAILRHHSPRVAVDQATNTVVDRYGGTRIASNIRALLRSRFGGRVRGAIVVIASDGWDSEPPEEMVAAMARLQRRAHRILWLNPRAGARGFQPLVGSMAAALSFCDDLLAADTVRDLARVIDAITAID